MNLHADPPCTNSWPERTWINQPDVKAALHISELVTWDWDSCRYNEFFVYQTYLLSSNVCYPFITRLFTFDSSLLPYVEVYDTMTPQYQYLLERVRGFIYHGDTDTMCNYIGGEWFVDSLEREVSFAVRSF